MTLSRKGFSGRAILNNLVYGDHGSALKRLVDRSAGPDGRMREQATDFWVFTQPRPKAALPTTSLDGQGMIFNPLF